MSIVTRARRREPAPDPVASPDILRQTWEVHRQAKLT
jgi:hypothetical protein